MPSRAHPHSLGAPSAHEDLAVRAYYAAPSIEASVRQYTEVSQHTHGVSMQTSVGLNAEEVVVWSIGSDLHVDFLARQHAGAGGFGVNLLGS